MSEVVIIGAGPVGLALALALHARGVRAAVLEQRSGPRDGSRSIGIHPPALELFDELGLGDRMLARGVRVRRGLAFAGSRPLGVVDFGACRGRHRYVLTLPQVTTEAILQEALDERAPGALRLGAEVRGLTPTREGVRVDVADANGRRWSLETRYAVGCDGRRSLSRAAGSIAFRGAPYPGRYAMGDIPDTTELGPDAAVFLHPRGLVESFPLPGHRRRWVIRREPEHGEGPAGPSEIAAAVEERTAHRLPPSELTGVSSFTAERFIAERFVSGPLLLAGDAAHVVSPIGGQGMNLGWLGARSLASALRDDLHRPRPGGSAIESDARRRRQTALAVARRAELNMWLGRPTSSRTREAFVRALLSSPLTPALARAFTMRGLR